MVNGIDSLISLLDSSLLVYRNVVISVYSSFVSLGKFAPRYLILFVAMVNGIYSLISLSDFPLLVYRNASDFLCIDFVSCKFAKFTD